MRELLQFVSKKAYVNEQLVIPMKEVYDKVNLSIHKKLTNQANYYIRIYNNRR